MEIERNINGIQLKFEVTDDEIIQSFTKRPIDERVVFFRKLAKADLKSFLEILQIIDIFNILRPLKK